MIDERPDVMLSDPLSEEEAEAGAGQLPTTEESGGQPLDPVAATLSKLTGFPRTASDDGCFVAWTSFLISA